MNVLVLQPLRDRQQAELEARHTVHRLDKAADRDALLAAVGPDIEVVVTNGHTRCDRDLLDRLPNLQLVSCFSAGFESIDVAALKERGVMLTNTSVALVDDVADMAIFLMLAARRSLVATDAYVRSGDWGRKGPYPLQSTLRGKRIGILGMGNIGRAIATRAAAMGLEILYGGRTAKPDLPFPVITDPVELARRSDILVVITAGGADTHKLVDAAVIEALGPTGTLVNVARGTVVDEEALIAALSDGRLGSAGLDVYLNEPRPDPRLAALPNVVLSPHHASGTVETRDAMHGLCLANVDALGQGRPLLSPVPL